jgi:hypothetical protein
MEDKLRTLIASGQVPEGLEITYDDRHGLWGGTAYTLRGSGRLERRTAPPAGAGSSSTRLLARDAVLELVGLLVELSAWEQRTPERQPVPDESRPVLEIRLEGKSSRVWERHHEMAANQRLIRVKKWFDTQLLENPAHGGTE